MNSLTIAYITNRRDCRIEWAYESIMRQAGSENVKWIVVDFYRDERDVTQGIWKTISENTKHVAPKPNPWNGPFRLTKENWFAASNARNTALCHCETSHIAYLDDLSVAMPGWLECALKAVHESPYIACGAYKKVKKLAVANGVVTNFEEYGGGMDSRWGIGNESGPVPIDGGKMFGCSVVIPIEWLLQINGFSEMSDGLGFEDCLTGIVLENNGYPIRYVRSMLTLESEELHHYTVGSDASTVDGVRISASFKRSDFGASPNDKSHAALNIAKISKTFPNYTFMRDLRQRILNGGSWPDGVSPQHEWFTEKPLKDL